MATPLVINGVTFQYPQQFDKNWGPTLTNWSSAVTSGMLQKAGGSFALTAEVDFGSSFGMKVKSIKSEETSIAQTGFLRLANASAGIVWRNALDNADLPLTVNASNQLTFNGISVGATTALTDSHILVGNVSNQPADVALSGDATITNAGVLTVANSAITNAKVSASAAIALSKLAPVTAYYWYAANVSGVLTPLAVTASRAVVSDANGLPAASAATSTEIGYVSGVTSAIQTQIDAKLSKSGGTMSGVLNMGSNKIQSVTAATATGEALAYGQNLPGVTTNSSAPAGSVGEIIEVTNTISAGVSDAVWNDYVSIPLTAGDWDVCGFLGCSIASTAFVKAQLGISASAGNTGAGLSVGINAAQFYQTSATMLGITLSIPFMRVSLASPTTYYLKFLAGFNNGTVSMDNARITARRPR